LGQVLVDVGAVATQAGEPVPQTLKVRVCVIAEPTVGVSFTMIVSVLGVPRVPVKLAHVNWRR
jgi:hypothetical protein